MSSALFVDGIDASQADIFRFSPQDQHGAAVTVQVKAVIRKKQVCVLAFDKNRAGVGFGADGDPVSAKCAGEAGILETEMLGGAEKRGG